MNNKTKRIVIIAVLIFVITSIIYLSYSMSVLPKMRLSGDEPSYLVMTYSMIYDKDIDLKNNYENRDYEKFGREWDTDPIAVNMPDGRLLPIHSVGFPILLIPAFLLGNRVGIVVFLNLATAFLVVQIFLLCFDLTKRMWISIICALLGGLTTPVFWQSMEVFPEIIAALLITLIIRSYFNNWEKGKYGWLVPVLSLMGLPWLHRRYYIIFGILLILYLIKIRKSPSRFLALAGSTIVNITVTFLFYRLIYKTWFPPEGNSWDMLFGHLTPQGILGTFLDQERGLFIYSPIFVLVFSGYISLYKLNRDYFWFTLISLVVGIVFISINFSGGVWWGAWSTLCRYLVIYIPFFCLALAASLKVIKNKVYYLVFGFLSAVSLLFTVLLINPSDPMKYLYYGGHADYDGVGEFLILLTKYIKVNLTNDLPSYILFTPVALVKSIIPITFILVLTLVFYFTNIRKYKPELID
jgi:hypothetical protein